jgi:hypothetical protein
VHGVTPSIAAVVVRLINSFLLVASLLPIAWYASTLTEDGEAPLRRRSSTASQSGGVFGFLRINMDIECSLGPLANGCHRVHLLRVASSVEGSGRPQDEILKAPVADWSRAKKLRGEGVVRDGLPAHSAS